MSSAAISASARPCTAGLGDDERREHRPRAGEDLAVHGLGVGVAGRLAEQHLPRVRVGLDVAGPGVDGARDARLRRLVGEQMLAPDGDELVAMALEQPAVQVELGREVVIDDRRRHTGTARDLVDRRAAVSALGEHLGGGALDHHAALLGAESFPL